mgnify:CR=1 FL=1
MAKQSQYSRLAKLAEKFSIAAENLMDEISELVESEGEEADLEE